jgi:hypothetical protein
VARRVRDRAGGGKCDIDRVRLPLADIQRQVRHVLVGDGDAEGKGGSRDLHYLVIRDRRLVLPALVETRMRLAKRRGLPFLSDMARSSSRAWIPRK